MLLPGVIASQNRADESSGGAGPVGSHRYWRLVITDADNGFTKAINELRFVDVDGVEHNATFTASSYLDAYEPFRMGDDDAYRAWAADEAVATVWADLGDSYAIEAVKLTARPDYTHQTPANFTVGYSDDALTYTDCLKVEGARRWAGGGNGETRLFSFSVDIWRLTVTATNGDDFTVITEFTLHDNVAGPNLIDTVSSPDANGRKFGSPGGYGGSGIGAMDGVSSGDLYYTQTTSQKPNFLEYRFPEEVDIAKFTLQSRTDGYSGQAPKDFALSHSTDRGFSYDLVAAFSESTGWSLGEVRTFTV